MTSPALAGLLLCCSGLGALRFGWRRQDPIYRWVVAIGWLSLATAIYACIVAWGVEYGISYVLAGITLVALLLVGRNAEVRPNRKDKTSLSSGTATSTVQKLLTFLAAGPLGGIVSCQLTLVLTRILPGTELNNMATAAVLFPILWGIFAYLSCLAGRPGRQVTLLIAVAAISSAALYL